MWIVNLNKVKAKMKEKEVTQEDLASELCLSEQTVNAKLNGKQRIYSDELFLIFSFLGVNKENIVDFLDEKLSET